jgi:ketosteroid isomerase-like protein
MQSRVRAPAWVHDVLAAVDANDATRFAGFIAPDGLFRFSNAEPVRGRAAIESVVAGFFRSIRGCQHELLGYWQDADGCAMRGNVTYIRHDGRQLTLPFANVFAMRGEVIAEYLIYVDVTPLYAA